MEFEDLLAPVAGEFDVDEALESWRWLVPEKMRALVVSAVGDLFLIDGEGAVFFLDTGSGTCGRVAVSVAEWEGKIREPAVLEEWFVPGFVAELRGAAVLGPGQCYSPVHPPILNGSFALENWPPTHWQAHFRRMGSIHEQIKDLPDGTVITKVHYTEL
jgi:hypothetical protein